MNEWNVETLLMLNYFRFDFQMGFHSRKLSRQWSRFFGHHWIIINDCAHRYPVTAAHAFCLFDCLLVLVSNANTMLMNIHSYFRCGIARMCERLWQTEQCGYLVIQLFTRKQQQLVHQVWQNHIRFDIYTFVNQFAIQLFLLEIFHIHLSIFCTVDFSLSIEFPVSGNSNRFIFICLTVDNNNNTELKPLLEFQTLKHGKIMIW